MTLERAKEWTDGFSTIDHYIRETWRYIYENASVSIGEKRLEGQAAQQVQDQLLEQQLQAFRQNRERNSEILMRGLRFVNRHGQPLRMMPRLELDPALLEQPLYH